MTSYKLANYIILRKIAVKDKCLPYLLVSDRSFCSKDKEVKNDAIEAKGSSTKEKEESEEEAAEVQASSPKNVDSNDAIKSAAKQKLMSLLSSIKVASDKPSKKASELNLAKPLKRISKKERIRQLEAEKVTPEKEMEKAVKAVASSFKEDSEKIESELASKVSSLRLTKTELVEEDTIEENPEINNEMNEKLMSSVEEVADTISESPIPPRSELAKRLMRLSIDQKLHLDKKFMRSVIEGMTIQPQQQVPPPKTIESRKQVKKFQSSVKVKRVNLFGSAPLNIFTPGAETKDESSNTFWKKLEEREVKLMTQFAPANAFEEMIMWTEQGKHWKFPINNDIDIGEEEKIGFHEHVFLEHHLKGFPIKGPIRQFMELVLVGLSKNPYITVERKISHIEWFRNYFKEKEEILREEGAIE